MGATGDINDSLREEKEQIAGFTHPAVLLSSFLIRAPKRVMTQQVWPDLSCEKNVLLHLLGL